MHENTDECALQIRFISCLTENTVCLSDGAGENMVTLQESYGIQQAYGQDKIQDFVSATPDGTHKYH